MMNAQELNLLQPGTAIKLTIHFRNADSHQATLTIILILTFRFAFTVASNVTIYVMTWVTLGVTGASQQVVNPDDVSDFRVGI